MAKTGIGRLVSAVTAAYVVNAILVVATNQILSPMAADSKRQLDFLVIDLISQCVYTIVAGYLFAVMAGAIQRRAMASLISLGLTVGTFSLITSWNTEPPWYGISLLLVYAPCVWLGCWLRGRLHPIATSGEDGSRRSNQDVADRVPYI
jgi:hypothetical protein